MAEGRRQFGIKGDWSIAALDPGVRYNTAREGGCWSMAAWVKEDEKASEHRQRKTETEQQVDKVQVAPGVTIASLRCFRAALIGPTRKLPKRLRLCR